MLSLLHLTEIRVFNANSVYPDQTPQNAASDLGLYCLPMGLSWNARHKTFTILWANSADDKLMTLFLFFLKHRSWYFMQIVFLGKKKFNYLACKV